MIVDRIENARLHTPLHKQFKKAFAVLADPALAPIKVGIFPLVKKEGMPEIARGIYDDLKKRFNCFYDEKGAVGRRYRRQDEAGTPFSASRSTAKPSRTRASPSASATRWSKSASLPPSFAPTCAISWMCDANLKSHSAASNWLSNKDRR
jgi:hypothetical protein